MVARAVLSTGSVYALRATTPIAKPLLRSYPIRAHRAGKGSPEREVPGELTPEGDDIVIEKSTQNLFVGTNAEMILRNRGIQTLVFTGIATEIGVETSARDAGARGFYPVVVSDGVSSMDREAHERSLQALARLGIVATMDEISAAIAIS